MAIEGLEDMLAALDAQIETIRDVTPELLVEAVEVVHGNAVAMLSLQSHEPGTPTPSSPGEPPAMISGALAASIVPGDLAGGGDTWSMDIGPTTVYARIQELGGVCGAGYRTTLPPRPYLAPALELSIDAIGEVFSDGWFLAL